jgi:hypothetical protein
MCGACMVATVTSWHSWKGRHDQHPGVDWQPCLHQGLSVHPKQRYHLYSGHHCTV